MNTHFEQLHTTPVLCSFITQTCDHLATTLAMGLEANTPNTKPFPKCGVGLQKMPMDNMSQPLPGPMQINARVLRKEIAPSWMEAWHVNGNKEADVLVCVADELHCIPETEANQLINYIKILT